MESEKLLALDRELLWHPYTSMTNPLKCRQVVGARGTRLKLADGRELVDGMSSWWCAIHGYNHPRLNAAAKRQIDAFSHVMFGGLTHEPAVMLGQKLVRMAPKGLERVFLADSGSVSVEVALKMAIQYWRGRGINGKNALLTVRGGYHGDTFGAMSVCDPVNGMHHLFRGSLQEQFFAPRPACRFDSPFDPESLAPIRELAEKNRRRIAALIIEPVVQGAGGMWFYHPEYLKGLREICDELGILLIFDEIATGFGRTKKLFASQWAGVSPDIMCVGKALTGGYMTLAATLATKEVAEGVSSGGGVFMHGPTFMGNPLACAVALESLEILGEGKWEGDVARIEKGLRDGLLPLKGCEGVADARVLGAIGVIETQKPVNLEALQDFFVEKGVWIRPFSNLVYLMPPFMASEEDIGALTGAVGEALSRGLHL